MKTHSTPGSENLIGATRQEKEVNDEHLYEELKRLRKDNARLKAEREIFKNRFVAPARHLWVETLPPVGSRRSSGRSDCLLLDGSDPVKKPGPGTLADVRVVTP